AVAESTGIRRRPDRGPIRARAGRRRIPVDSATAPGRSRAPRRSRERPWTIRHGVGQHRREWRLASGNTAALSGVGMTDMAETTESVPVRIGDPEAGEVDLELLEST